MLRISFIALLGLFSYFPPSFSQEASPVGYSYQIKGEMIFFYHFYVDFEGVSTPIEKIQRCETSFLMEIGKVLRQENLGDSFTILKDLCVAYGDIDVANSVGGDAVVRIGSHPIIKTKRKKNDFKGF